MRLLFLRGKVPTDRDPKQIMFNKLSENCDMWTQLAAKISMGGCGRIWYWGGTRQVRYSGTFIETWLKSFGSGAVNLACDFEPNTIFARGGFPEYDKILAEFPKAYKIYYGAGKRYFPQTKFKQYDLILVDTLEQRKGAQDRFSKTRVELLVKPAADNIFKPVVGQKKIYDVIFVGNESKGDMKGHRFVLSHIPPGLKVLVVGIASKKLKRKYQGVTFTGWVPRRKLPKYYAQSKIAVIACVEKDSGPRVLAEALACGCPVLVRAGLRCDVAKYVNSSTGMITADCNFAQDVTMMVVSYEGFNAREYYLKNLSLDVAADHIRSML